MLHPPGVKFLRITGTRSSQHSPLALRAGVAAASLAVVAAGAVVVAAPAAAGACSATGGSSDHLMWTGKGYTCAYVAASGNKSIGFGQIKSWTSNTAMGYSKRYTCHGQTGGVDVEYMYTDSAGTNLGSSITYTATNLSSGDRHWNAAVLWNTANKAASVADNQYVHNCSTDKSIGVNQFFEPKVSLSGPTSYKTNNPGTYTVTVQNNQGGPSPAGLAYLFAQSTPGKMNPPAKDCSGNATNKTTPVDFMVAQPVPLNSAGTAQLTAFPLPAPVGYKFYAVYSGYPLTSDGRAGYCLAPPQPTGLTPQSSNVMDVKVNTNYTTSSVRTAGLPAPAPDGASVQPRGDYVGPNPQLKVVNRSATAPNRVSARCPKGKVPVQLSLASPTVPLDPDNLNRTKRGASMSGVGLPDGTQIALQLVCRPAKAKAVELRGISWGSVKADTFDTNRKRSGLFGGLGNDRLRVTNADSNAWGGPGRDFIKLNGNQSGAAGGPGADRLVSMATGKTLLNGGPGRDTMIGAKGATIINALDGKGGDTIICKSSRNIVYADANDKLQGPCTIG